MIEAKNCPHHNLEWYDITDIATAKLGKNSKLCVNLNCQEKCTSTITNDGLPFYDPDGSKLKLLY